MNIATLMYLIRDKYDENLYLYNYAYLVYLCITYAFDHAIPQNAYTTDISLEK